MTSPGISPYERITRKLTIPDDPEACHVFTGALSCGYGVLRIKKQTVLVHRFIYEYHHGEIPFNKVVMHQCNNRKCCNPKHLKVGTHAENTQHAKESGATNRPTRRSLTKEQVLEIRTLIPQFRNNAAVGRKFGVSKSVIRAIQDGKTYQDFI